MAGEADLVELDERSLSLRGKRSKADKTKKDSGSKKRALALDEAVTSSPSKKAKVEVDLTSDGDDQAEDMQELEALIDGSDKTVFQKRCLKALLQIPPGQFSTYGERSWWTRSSCADFATAGQRLCLNSSNLRLVQLATRCEAILSRPECPVIESLRQTVQLAVSKRYNCDETFS